MSQLQDEYNSLLRYPNAYIKLFVNGHVCVQFGYIRRDREYPEALAHRVEKILRTALLKYPCFSSQSTEFYCESGWA